MTGTPIGATRVQLPSRGYLYDGNLENGEVSIRPMTTNEEKLLLSKGKSRTELFTMLLNACLETKGITANDMLATDRIFLLFMLRNISYGADYSFLIKCPECGEKLNHLLKIPDDIHLVALEPKDAEEPYEVTLPMSGAKVGLRRLRGRDELQIQDYAKRNIELQPTELGDPRYIYSMALQIVMLNGKDMGILDSLSFCKTLIGGDSLAVQYAIEDHQCGLDLSMTFTCRSCGEEFDEEIPLTEEFFRPQSRARRRKRRHSAVQANIGGAADAISEGENKLDRLGEHDSPREETGTGDTERCVEK